MARAATELGIREVAVEAGVSPNTIARFERGEKLKSATVMTIRAVFEGRGIQFLESGDVSSGPGVALR